ncbi:MAG TPA: type I glyceraldehyde-3-phosphate dehydrogenase [Oligoflexia bacterium]|nr:type I glyceraldehyde-3-phosphate dehydrogenase [Oligoflexia bacterium]HMP27040.1 type I glyceraldehyde-3-phosphate dehydrogenase [Oligoflexia bacterium]
MTTRIAINGFGRIGRNILRLLSAKQELWQKLEVVAINDLTDAATLAHLLKYDSVHGKFQGEVSASESEITINNKKIKITAEKDPSKLNWRSWQIDLVLECTGLFTKREKAAAHLEAGAKTVIISAPSPDPDVTIAYGVNQGDYKPAEHKILSCASCTTNCLAPIAKVIDETFGVVYGSMTTIHSYTNDQQILDLPHKDLRRARAAGISMIPTTTGAAKALGLVLPKLAGKVDGFAVRVPTANVSLVDFVARVERPTTVERVNEALTKASQEGALKGILGVSNEPLVSIDYVGDQRSSIADLKSTMVIGNELVKVVSWYDNEIGFSARMIDVATIVGANLS